MSSSTYSKQSRKTKQGSFALSSIIRRSSDVAVKSIKSRYTGKGAPVNIANDIKTIMSLLNTEEKHADTAAISTVSLSTPLVLNITSPAQGNSGQGRNGDSIKVTKFDLNLDFVFEQGAVATSTIPKQTFNWYLVRYLKTPSTGGTSSFAISEFLDVDFGGTYYSPGSLPATDTNQNFQVMASGQEVVEFDYIGTASQTGDQLITVTHDCSFHQLFNGSSASTITSNSCFLVVTALRADNTSGASSVKSNIRMWYIDN